MDSTAPGRPSAIHRRPAAWVVLKEPFITVALTASKARALRLAVGAMKLAAALLTTLVNGPCRVQISPIAASTRSALRTSTACTCTVPGRPAEACTAASSRTAWRRPHRWTWAPCRTRWAATPRPRPVPPPVMRIRFPRSRSGE